MSAGLLLLLPGAAVKFKEAHIIWLLQRTMISPDKNIKGRKESSLSLWRLQIISFKKICVLLNRYAFNFLPETSEMGTEVLALELDSFSLSPLLPSSATSVVFLQFDNSSGATAFLCYYFIFAGRHSCLHKSVTEQQRRKKPVRDLVSHGCF